MSSRMQEIFGAPVITGWDRNWPERGRPEESAVVEAVRSGVWCSLGSELVARVEERLARPLGAKHVVLTSSGTTAISAIAWADDLQRGNTIVPAGTFVPGTLGGLVLAGGRPKAIDTSLNWTQDPEATEAAIDSDTVAIFAVSAMYDRAAEMPRLGAIADSHRLALYNDAAHTWGAILDGKPLAGFGRAAAHSFQAHKNMTAGELGAVSTNDADLAARVRVWVEGGRPLGLGANIRPPVLHVALLEAQLERAQEQHALRDRVFAETRAVLRRYGLETAEDQPPGNVPPQYELSAMMPEGSLQGLHRDTVCEAMSYLLGVVFQPPYWGSWEDPKWEEIRTYNGRLQQVDASYRRALQSTLERQPVWQHIALRGITAEHVLGLNQESPERVDEALSAVIAHADQLHRLEPPPRPVM